MVMASEAEFGCHDDSEYFKGDLRGQSSILSFMAATWDYYGGKWVVTIFRSQHTNEEHYSAKINAQQYFNSLVHSIFFS